MAPIKNLSLFLLCHLLLLFIDDSNSKCQKSYPCRDFSIEFPFTDIHHSECGLFSVNCSSKHQNPLIYLREYPMDLLGEVSENKLLIYDPVLANYFSRNSCYSFANVSLPNSPFVSFSYSPNLTFFNCYNPSKDVKAYFVQYENKSCDISTTYYKPQATEEAPPVIDDVLPGSGCVMNQMALRSNYPEYSDDIIKMFTPNFTLEWHVSEACYECHDRGGQCLTNDNNQFYCNRGNVLIFISYLG